MIFQEKKENEKYEYYCRDLFGEVTIVSETKLDGKLLDWIIGVLLAKGLSASEITGEVKHKDGVVSYVLKPESQWQEDTPEDTDESWNATPTWIRKREKGSRARSRSRVGIFAWLLRFAEAFREAWKKNKK
jgi:hypothetical protein